MSEDNEKQKDSMHKIAEILADPNSKEIHLYISAPPTSCMTIAGLKDYTELMSNTIASLQPLNNAEVTSSISIKFHPDAPATKIVFSAEPTAEQKEEYTKLQAEYAKFGGKTKILISEEKYRETLLAETERKQRNEGKSPS